ncbi:MAG: ABC transporter permease [Calditrichaeota bacterium]|nr:ABC transporter permease [Calditrichota bacterium]
MNLFFFIREGIIGLKRARMSALISIISLCLALTLIGIFSLAGINLKDVVYRFYKEIEIEAFLDPAIQNSEIKEIENKIAGYQETASVRFISREQALKEFQEIFGEDIGKVLSENPLPPSFRIVLKSSHSTPETVEIIARELTQLKGIQEVIYHKEIIQFLHRYLTIGVTVVSIIALTMLIIITILVFNTIRLTIYARRNIIQIMKLVGATNYFIKGPFIFEGIFQGLLGGALSATIIWGISRVIISTIFPELNIENYFYLLLLGLGMILGLVGSYLSVNKYLQY